MHIDARQVDAVGVQRSGRHDLLDFRYADLAAHRGGRVEVARGLAEHQIARRIRLPGLDNGQVGNDPALQNICLAVEILVILAVRDDRADAGLGIEAGYAAAARPHPFGQGALRVELQLQLARQVLAHELGVLSDIGGDHLLHLPRLQQDADAEIVDARVVGRERQVLGPGLLDRLQQQFRDAAQPEAAGSNEHPVLQKPVECLGRRSEYFLHCPTLHEAVLAEGLSGRPEAFNRRAALVSGRTIPRCPMAQHGIPRSSVSRVLQSRIDREPVAQRLHLGANRFFDLRIPIRSIRGQSIDHLDDQVADFAELINAEPARGPGR